MFLGVPKRFFYEVERFPKKNFFLMLGKKIPAGRIVEKSENLDTIADMVNFMKNHDFNQIERARSPRSGRVRKSSWVFLRGFSMKF